jgi:hypothetical protein
MSKDVNFVARGWMAGLCAGRSRARRWWGRPGPGSRRRRRGPSGHVTGASQGGFQYQTWFWPTGVASKQGLGWRWREYRCARNHWNTATDLYVKR